MPEGADENEEVEDDELDDDDENEQDDDDDAKGDVKKLTDQLRASRKSETKFRRTLKADRTKIKELEARLAAAESGKSKDDDSKLAREVQEATERAERAEARAQKAATQHEATINAEKLGFRNPAKAYRLIDPDDVEYDDDGRPTNIRALLRDELRDDPSLKRRRDDDDDDDDRDADAGRGRRSRGKRNGDDDMNAEIRAAAGR